MPYYVVQKTIEAMNSRGIVMNGSRILIVGLAYKKNVDDVRESPTFKLWRLLEQNGAHVDYCDPYCLKVHKTREYPEYCGRESVSADHVAEYDAVLIATAHDCLDYQQIKRDARLVIDTRHAVPSGENVVRA